MDNIMLTGNIFVYGDIRDADMFSDSLDIVSGALKLKKVTKTKVVFVIIVQKVSAQKKSIPKKIIRKDNFQTVEQSAQEALKHGADSVLFIETKAEGLLTPAMISDLLKQAVDAESVGLFLFPLTDILREVSARCAFSLMSGMIAECVDLKVENDEIVAVCPSHDGEIMAELGFSTISRPGFITIQKNAFQKKEAKKPANSIHRMGLEPSVKCCLNLISREKIKHSGKSLEKAKKIVVGGAGAGNIEGFRLIRKLASALGAEVGATRPPVFWHWIDEDKLIGQTGKTIKPELLITAGTSGAVQYTAGITKAKFVVAVNKDINAPIFKLANLGIAADIAVFIPVLTKLIKKTAMRSLADSRIMESEADGSDFGSKFLNLRKFNNFTRENIAEKTGRTPEFIKDVEENKTTPPVGFLLQLSEVFDVDPGTLLNDDEKKDLTGQRAKEYTKRTDNYFYKTLTPNAESEHLRVFQITIEQEKYHKPVAYRHDGEEFIYVLEGKLELTLDNKKHKLISGESIKFNSNIPHKLKSLGDVKTKCLVTLYTP